MNLQEDIKIRIFNKNDQLIVQEMIINGLIDAANNYPSKIKDGVSSYLQRSLNEDLRDIHNHYFKKGIFFVAVINDQIIGSLGAELVDNSTFRLKRLSVKPNYRRKGIAKKLLFSIEEWVNKINGNLLILGTSEAQKNAVKFWKNSGFKVIDSKVAESGVRVYSLEKRLNSNF